MGTGLRRVRAGAAGTWEGLLPDRDLLTWQKFFHPRVRKLIPKEADGGGLCEIAFTSSSGGPR